MLVNLLNKQNKTEDKKCRQYKCPLDHEWLISNKHPCMHYSPSSCHISWNLVDSWTRVVRGSNFYDPTRPDL